jgi:hypothetical protein
MSIDTSKTLSIESSPWKLLFLGLLGILMTALSGAIAFGLIPVSTLDYRYYVAWLGVLLFGACTVLAFWRALGSRGPVVILTPSGLTDTRVASAEIPWRGVQGISTWAHKGQKVMVLAVDPAIEKSLPLTRIARMTRRVNASLGADGLCVTAQGLKISYENLLMQASAYAEAAASGGVLKSKV